MNNQKLNIHLLLQSLYQPSSVVSTQSISNNFFIFSDSSCLNLSHLNSSINSSHNTDLIEKLIEKIKVESSKIEAFETEISQIHKILDKIQIEVREQNPRKDVLHTYLDLLPNSMNTLTSLTQLLLALGFQ